VLKETSLVPVLVLANKQDIPGALDESSLRSQLGLQLTSGKTVTHPVPPSPPLPLSLLLFISIKDVSSLRSQLTSGKTIFFFSHRHFVLLSSVHTIRRKNRVRNIPKWKFRTHLCAPFSKRKFVT
jgi:hypothetical protein